MNAFVFAGPTISHDEVRRICDAVCVGPAAQGDVYRICQARPRAIGIIDGYFDGVPSVWHKEILWAMSQGIHVFGSASMGALRAAELHAFGMRGVGAIFEQFRDGLLEDDDEVAVLHGPAEAGYAALSEPMVNIRATLDRARAEGVVDDDVARRLTGIGKDLYYPQRSWDTVLDCALGAVADAESINALRAWLDRDKVDVKREDALAMLGEMARFLETGPDRNTVSFDFEWTEMWDMVVAHSGAVVAGVQDGGDSVSDDRVLDELRLDANEFRMATVQAALRFLALREARHRGIAVGRPDLQERLKRFRIEKGLFSQESLDEYLAECNIDPSAFERLAEDDAMADALIGQFAHRLDAHRIAHLRASGAYRRLARRAKAKRNQLRTAGLKDPRPADLGLIPTQLVSWYFSACGRPIPEDLDAWAVSIGLAGRDDLHGLLAREYVYSLAEQDATDESQEH